MSKENGKADILYMPGMETTVRGLLTDLGIKAEKFESIMVVCFDKDNQIHVGHSTMSQADKLLLARALGLYVDEEFIGEYLRDDN